MIDIHTHVLPEVDDGAQSLEEACAMVEMSAANGITHLVATPHCNSLYPFSFERNRTLLAELAAATQGRLALSCGCDLHVSNENLQRVLATPEAYTINQRNYLLVEFSDFGISSELAQQMHQLRLRGLVPVITHPERNRLLSRGKFPLLQQLMQMGCSVQVTAGSLSGRFGTWAQKVAHRLFAARMVHLVASDAHNTERRPPRLSEARAAVARLWGAEVAQAVFVDNPRAVVEGEPLPYSPESVFAARKKRFFFF